MPAVVRLSPGVAFGFTASVVGPYLSINILIGMSVWILILALFALTEERLALARDATRRCSYGELFASMEERRALARDATATRGCSCGELFIIGPIAQVYADSVLQHLGDSIVVVGFAMMITSALRGSPFACARASYRGHGRPRRPTGA